MFFNHIDYSILKQFFVMPNRMIGNHNWRKKGDDLWKKNAN